MQSFCFIRKKSRNGKWKVRKRTEKMYVFFGYSNSEDEE